ncbi:transposase [Paraburkholderia sp. RL18-085-BIA-A]
MSPAFIKGGSVHLPNARLTFDRFHVVAQASFAPGTNVAARTEDRPGSQGCAPGAAQGPRPAVRGAARPTSMRWSPT